MGGILLPQSSTSARTLGVVQRATFKDHILLAVELCRHQITLLGIGHCTSYQRLSSIAAGGLINYAFSHAQAIEVPSPAAAAATCIEIVHDMAAGRVP